MRHPIRAALAAALLAAWALPADAQAPTSIRVTQARAHPDRISAYVATLGRDLRPVAPPAGARFSAAMGTDELAVDSVVPFDRSGQGTGYIFLVDVSRSLSAERFAELQAALRGWVGRMGPADRAAIVAFGDSVRLVADFTASRDTLRVGLDGLAPREGRTMLFGAIGRALELDRRADETLPDRRVIVLLSDGINDAPQGMTRAELTDAIRDHRVPLHAIGYPSGRADAASAEGLATLAEMARRSGGAYLDGRGGRLDQLHATLYALVRSVYALRLACDGCLTGTAAQRLTVTLRAGTTALTDGVDVRPAPEPEGWTFSWELMLKIVLGLTISVGLVVTVRRIVVVVVERRRRLHVVEFAVVGRPETAAPTMAPAEEIEVDLAVHGPGTQPSTRRVHLSGVRIVGRDLSRADVAFPDDNLMSGQHFELVPENGRVLIRDLGSRNGTVVNGVKIRPTHRLEEGDVISAGETRMRVTFPDAAR